MANEITVNVTLTCLNGSFRKEVRPAAIQVTQSTLGGVSSVQTIGTSEEALALGDVSTEGYAFFQNLDATNFVTIGSYTGGTTYNPVVKLKAGEFALLRLDSSQTFYAKADTASVKLWFEILEN